MAAETARQLNEEERRRALLTLAKHAGNSKRAAEELNGNGITVSDKTLVRWRDGQYADLYRQIHETYGREIESALVPEFREAAIAAAAAARLAIDKTVEDLHAGRVKDTAGAARNLMVTGATAMDKVYLATDRPTVVTKDRDATEILAGLARKLGLVEKRKKAIDSTAEEIHDG